MKKLNNLAMRFCVMFLSAVMLCTLGCLNQPPKPKTVKASFWNIPIVIKLSRHDSPWIKLPASQYNDSTTYFLGEKFLNFNCPNWWAIVRADMAEAQADFKAHSIEFSIREIPSEEWLKKNARRGVETSFIVELNLPSGGVLQRKVSEADYLDFVERYPLEKSSYPKMDPRHIIVSESGNHIFSNWNIFEGTKKEGKYYQSLEDVQKAVDGQLLFESSGKNKYAVIQLPRELLELKGKDLEPGFVRTFMIDAKHYTVMP